MSNLNAQTTPRKHAKHKPFDEVEFLMAAEGDGLTNEQFIDGMQHLINSGTVWKLQGSWQRAAQLMIKKGICHA